MAQIPGIEVMLTHIELSQEVQTTPERPYGFIYTIKIQNKSSQTIIIKGRKWVLTNQEGVKNITEGSGVGGGFPRLKPGGEFSYQGYHLIDSTSSAEGAYLGHTEEGEGFIAVIPSFMMKIPLSI